MMHIFKYLMFILLSDGFLSKLLSGNGFVDIDLHNRNLPQARIKITNVNLEYLEDYKKIMEHYGMTPKVHLKQIIVRSSLNLISVKNLLRIGAFRNNPNESKLRFFIDSREVSK